MALTLNPHVRLFNNFYVKKNDVDIKLASTPNATRQKTITPSEKPVKKTDSIEYSWNSGNKKLVFNIPSDKDELTGENLAKLNNYSFIHSLLYIVDPEYYAGLIEQKKADCVEFIEILRKDFYVKEKISKEASSILQNLENNIYTDTTIGHIVNFFNSFHLIILSSDTTEAPKLFTNGYNKSKKTNPNYKSASTVILMYFDHNKEVYYPIMYNLDKRDSMYISWKEEEFLQFIRAVTLWGKPSETKKWAVADLRDWITYFELNIDVSLDKKAILEALPTIMV
jgi:hypothetical protein